MRLLTAVFVASLSLSAGSTDPKATAGEAIQDVLKQQAAAWNRGDLKQFVASYAQHCTLIGSTISESTREQVLAHYEQKYPSQAAMGTLEFSGLTVHRLDARVATVTGHWHLQRDAASGGSVGGLFSLVFRSFHGHWQIELDHTS